MTSDERLMTVYRLGWEQCYDGVNRADEFEGPERTAYICGWWDYIAGDDVTSVDLKTRDEILSEIKERYNRRTDL